VQPRFGYGTRTPHLTRGTGVPVTTFGDDAVAVRAWNAGLPQFQGAAVASGFRTEVCTQALLALPYAHPEQPVVPSRARCEAHLDHTIATWRHWMDRRCHSGPWREAVVRSALALKLVVFARSIAPSTWPGGN